MARSRKPIPPAPAEEWMPSAEEWVGLYLCMSPNEQDRAWWLLRNKEGLPPYEHLLGLKAGFLAKEYQWNERGMDRAGRGKTEQRYRIIHQLVTQQGFGTNTRDDWLFMVKYLREHHPEWLPKERPSRAKNPAKKTPLWRQLQIGYNNWLRKQTP